MGKDWRRSVQSCSNEAGECCLCDVSQDQVWRCGVSKIQFVVVALSVLTSVYLLACPPSNNPPKPPPLDATDGASMGDAPATSEGKACAAMAAANCNEGKD